VEGGGHEEQALAAEPVRRLVQRHLDVDVVAAPPDAGVKAREQGGRACL
jgi:hypothetical protein